MNINGNESNGNLNEKNRSENRPGNEWVLLNVGGVHYKTTKSTLCRFPDSFLARLCHDNNALKSQKDREDAILIDRDGEYFSVVLNFLRHGNIILNKNLVEEGVLEEAEFYNIPELVKMCEKRIQARQQQEIKSKPVYRFIQCCEKEIVNVISSLSDGWRFEQLLLHTPSQNNNNSETEFFCVVSSDSANYCGTISHKAKQIQQSACYR